MSYSSQSELSRDIDFFNRLTAAAAVEVDRPEDPNVWANQHITRVAASPGFADAYESAIVAEVPRPGNDPAVISDAMILSAVQAEIAASVPQEQAGPPQG